MGILKDVLVLAIVGLVLGLSGAYPLLKVLSGVLFGIGGLEVTAIVACTLVMLLIVSLSAYVPMQAIVRLNVAEVLKDV